MLGGGGEYFIAWLLGFAHGLRNTGVSYDLADLIVGTSAGAIVGSAAAADRLGLLRDDIDLSATGGFDTDERVQPQSGARA